MTIKHIKNLNSALDSLGATAFARICAKKKARIFIFHICDIKLSAALILKQESISAGGDFITPKELVLGEQKLYSGVLIATALQLEKIIAKCAIQPFGLKKLGANLKEHLKGEICEADSRYSSADSHESIKSKNPQSPQIMGIINITEDSFYAPSRVNSIDKILQKIEAMINEGVAIIDIGAASSRPDSERIASKVELERLREPIEAIFSAGFTQRAIFSIDSYNYECAEFCANRGFSIINDIEGLRDMRLAELALKSWQRIISAPLSRAIWCNASVPKPRSIVSLPVIAPIVRFILAPTKISQPKCLKCAKLWISDRFSASFLPKPKPMSKIICSFFMSNLSSTSSLWAKNSSTA